MAVTSPALLEALADIVDREHLRVLAKTGCEAVQRETRLDRGDHVLGNIVEDGGEAGRVDDEIEAAGRIAETHGGRAAARSHRQLLRRAQREDPAHLIRRAGAHQPPGLEPVDRHGGERGGIRDHVRASDDLGESFPDRRRGHGHAQIQVPAGSRGAAGLNASPQAGWEGRSLPGFMIPSGSRTRRKRAMKARSASPN